MKKRLLSLLLVICMLASVLPVINLAALAADGDVPTTMYIQHSEINNIPTAIGLYKTSGTTSGGGGSWGGGGGGWNQGGGGTTTGSNNQCALFLPGNTDYTKCFLSWEGGLSATLNGKTYASGSLPIAAPGEKETVTFTKNNATTTFEISTYQGSKDVKAIFIEIDESQGTISAMNNDRNHETECTGEIYVDGERYGLPKMKGRGNYTWTSAVQKHPYNLTLDTKTNLLGIDSEPTKKWSILCNIDDHTLLRDQVAYDMAYQMGIGQDSTNTDVWMNGEYQGTYLLTPKYDSFVSNDGYLLEHDNKIEDSVDQGGDPQFTMTDLTDRISIKKIGINVLGGVESVDTIKAAAKTIESYTKEAWEAVNSTTGKNSKGKYYTDYFDLESWAAFWLMQEYIKDYDVNAGSKLFSRLGTADTDKLIAGPLWDCGNALGRTQNNPALGSAAEETNGYGFYITKISGGNSFFKALAKHDDFMEEVYKVYNRNHELFDKVAERTEAYGKEIEASAEMNFVKVTRETYNTCNVNREMTKEAGTEYEQHYKVTNTWRDYMDNLVTFVTARSKFFDANYTRDIEPEFGYRGYFRLGQNASVTVYETQDTTTGGSKDIENVYARDSATGEIVEDGNGQINFKVDVANGYSLENVKVEPVENYKNLKTPADTGVEGLYRLTKVTGPVYITVATAEVICEHEFVNGKCKLCGKEAYKVTFDCDEHCSVTVYPTQDLTVGGEANAKTAYARSSADGSIDISGDGQVSFVVSFDDGYRLSSISADPQNYKNFKTPNDTFVVGYYRLTKVSGDITVKITSNDGKGPQNITFNNPSLYTIINQASSTVDAKGFHTTATADAFEPTHDQLTGTAATTPKDVLSIPVSGDWEATAKILVDSTSGTSSYEYFGFYAAQGSDYQNMVGIRGAESSVQDFKRLNGTITENRNVRISQGFNTYKTCYFRIAKTGTTYVTSFSSDGTNYRTIATNTNTGIAADRLLIDAYVGRNTGYSYTVESVTFANAGACDHTYVESKVAPTCTEVGYTAHTCSKCGDVYKTDPVDPVGHTFTNGKCIYCGLEPYIVSFNCDRHCTVTVVESQAEGAATYEKVKEGYPRDSATGEILLDGNGQVNFIVVPGDGYAVDTVTAEPAGTYKNLKTPDDTLIENGYRVTKVTGNLTVKITTKATGSVTPGQGLEDVDFTDDSLYTIINKTSAEVRANGLYLVSSKDAFESCNGQISEFAPKDVVSIPVEGDWEATMKFSFDQGSSRGYYEFFGFYAAEGDDYQNLAGIRGGDGSMQDFLRVDGTVTADTDGKKTSTGLKSSQNHWYRIAKSGTTYTCYWSTDGENFTEIFKYENTGIEADQLLVDAYSGMATGYNYTIESVTFGGEACQHDYKSVVTKATCTAGGFTTWTCSKCGDSYVTDKTPVTEHNFVNGKCAICGLVPFTATFNCDANCTVTAVYSQAEDATKVENAKSAYARDSATGAVDASGEGQINFIVVPKAGYEVDTVTAEPAGSFKNLKLPADTLVENGYRVTKVTGNLTVKITTKATGSVTPGQGLKDVDFKDNSLYTIINKTSAEVRANGLYLVSSKDAFEPCNGQISEFAPKDVVSIPVEGDWEATMKFSFDQGSSQGYYEFFGFYAAEGDDYQNLAGIRGGDGAMQDFLRVDGTVTADTDGKKTSTGLKSSKDHWYRIAKSGTTYTCYWSTDGKNFTEIFKYENTGIEADQLLIDAYSGMATGYNYTIESVTFGGEACQHDYKSVVTKPTCTSGGCTTWTCSKCGDSYVTDETPATEHNFVNGKCTICGIAPFTATFNCDANCTVTVAYSQAEDAQQEANAKTAYARNSDTGAVDVSGDGQINFIVVPKAGYEVDSVTAEPAGSFKNLKLPADTLVENGYRITKISGNLNVNITTKKSGCEHTYKSVATAPTCTTAGYTTYTCTKCGDTYREDGGAGKITDVEPEITVPSGLSSKRSNMTYGTVYNLTYHSTVCGRDKKVNVQVPANYDESKTYPVLYLLHGVMGSENDMVSNGTMIQNMVADGLAKEMIIVCPNMYSGATASPSGINQASMEGYDKFSDELVTDLMPFIKENFSIKEGKANTALAGFSLGGRETLSIGLFHPNEIGYLCAISSAPGVVAGKDNFMEHPGQFKEDEVVYAEGTEPYLLMMCSGDRDSVVGTFPQSYDTLYTKNGIDHIWWVVPGADHGGATSSGIYNFAKYVFQVESSGAPLGHDYQAVVTAPTCTKPGYTTYTCSRCKDSYQADTVSATGHKWDEGKVTTKPTETTAGVMTYTCTVCSEKRTETIPADGHTHDYKAVVTAPTCTKDGYTTYTCSKCGESYTSDTVKALGHDYKAVKTEATCTTAGYTTYTCSRCKDTYKGDEVKALGHDYKAVKTAPTCTKAGYTTYTCSRCKDSYQADTVAATGHKWDEGKVTTKPTETTAGVMTYTCTVCGEKRTESIPADGHTHDYKAVVTAPTCTAAGYTTYTCSKCGESYKGDEVEALGHDFKDGKCTRCGADDPDYKPEEPKECPSKVFTDAPKKGNWAHEGIDYCVANKLMNGMTATTFVPNGTVTRGQLVTILYRMAGSPEVTFKGTFTDVKAGKFYSNAVEWAAANSIVNGITATTFQPDTAITREQIATILYRYSKSPAVEGDLSAYPDAAKAGNYAKNALVWATKEGLINGVKSGDVTELQPKAVASRAQIAAIIMRFQKGSFACD